MKIMLTTSAEDGLWSYSMELARGLSMEDVRCELVVAGPPPDGEQRAEAALIPGVDLHMVGGTLKTEDMFGQWRVGERLLDLEGTLQPDLVHLNGHTHGCLPWKAPTVMVSHTCSLAWWRMVRGQEPPAEAAPEGPHMVADHMLSVDRLVSPSRTRLKTIRRLYGAPLDGTVIPQGRDPSTCAPRAKACFIFSPSSPGDLAREDTLERVAPRLPWPVFLGWGRGSPPANTGDMPHLHKLGKLTTEELRRWLAHAPIVVLNRRYEPYGLLPLDSALSGAAMVLPRIPELEETWRGAACFVPPDDEDALVRALKQLSSSPEIRARYSDRARRRALCLGARRMVRSYLSVYREIARCDRN